MSGVNGRGVISRISTGEAYLTGYGSRAFSMLQSFVESIYSDLGFERISFLDVIDLYSTYLRSNDGLVDGPFYTVETSNVQKNVSSSREAVFEKSTCDMGFFRSSQLRLALDLASIAGAFRRFHETLGTAVTVTLAGRDLSEQGGPGATAASVLRSQSIDFDTRPAADIDDTIEIKFHAISASGEKAAAGFITVDNSRIIFSLTGGLERTIRSVFSGLASTIPFAINPCQLVVVTNSASRDSAVWREISAIEKRGHSVVWHECGGGRLAENAYLPVVSEYLGMGAHMVLVLPDLYDTSKAVLCRAGQKISGMGFFQLLAIYIQKSFRGNS